MKGKITDYFRNLSLVEIKFISFLSIYEVLYYLESTYTLLVNPHKAAIRKVVVLFYLTNKETKGLKD